MSDQKKALERLKRRRAAKQTTKKSAPRWVVIQYREADASGDASGYSALTLHTDMAAASDAAKAASDRLAGAASFGAAFFTPVVGGGGPHVTVRRAKNADVGWRQAALWGTEAAAREFVRRGAAVGASSISAAHDYAGRLPP